MARHTRQDGSVRRDAMTAAPPTKPSIARDTVNAALVLRKPVHRWVRAPSHLPVAFATEGD